MTSLIKTAPSVAADIPTGPVFAPPCRDAENGTTNISMVRHFTQRQKDRKRACLRWMAVRRTLFTLMLHANSKPVVVCVKDAGSAPSLPDSPLIESFGFQDLDLT
ncbi:hypothetical protein DPMN_095258 [Dreissena polymorpha]|uniref:Uncharacterized protein n=1 Tax=Dreissena polymorpha TaxID=45954 RepID=A0A9D4L712_DREPO|nr:hypothetical protein DPMN_095258 [Dreissena polymorpha]